MEILGISLHLHEIGITINKIVNKIMADKEKEAYWKGYNDAKRSEKAGVISELFSPSYSPPREHKEAYKAGWKRAKEEK